MSTGPEQRAVAAVTAAWIAAREPKGSPPADSAWDHYSELVNSDPCPVELAAAVVAIALIALGQLPEDRRIVVLREAGKAAAQLQLEAQR